MQQPELPSALLAFDATVGAMIVSSASFEMKIVKPMIRASCYGWEGPSGPAQIFYDNPQTLRAKYELAVSLGVGGVGPYFLNCLSHPHEMNNVSWARDMWAALRDFANPK
eukprot:COSAG02_NODE_1704_length_11240_cov_9.848308_7_plen_110_part_00